MRRKSVFIATPFESLMAKRGNRLPKLAEFLVSKAHQVEYVTTNFSHARKEYFGEEEIEQCRAGSPYKLTVLRTFGYNKNISIGRVLSHVYLSLKYFLYLVRHLHKGDVLVIPARPPELILCAALLGHIKNAAVILDITDIWPDMLCGVSRLTFGVFRLYCNVFLKVSLKRIDRFVISAPCFRDWLNRYVPNANSALIPLGFDAERWQSATPKNRQYSSDISLVYVGLLQKQIDVRPILEALVGRKHYTFTIIGDGGEGERFREVQDFIRKHEMDNVSVVGRLSPEDVTEHLRNHDIGIVPMISSSIPNKVFDYIAAHLPIIALGDNDTSDLVREYDIGWSRPFDGEQVGELLDRLISSDIARKARNVGLIRDRFSRENLYETFARLVDGREQRFEERARMSGQEVFQGHTVSP